MISYVQHTHGYWVKKDIDSDIKMSGEWICKTKEALQRVYVTTETTCKNLVKGGLGRTSQWHKPVPSWGEESFICFSLHSKQYRVLQAHNQTACSRVNRIWGLSWELSATGAKLLIDTFRSRGAKQTMSTQRQFPLPVFWGHQTRARGADREHVCYMRLTVEEPSLKSMSARTQSCTNRAVGHPGWSWLMQLCFAAIAKVPSVCTCLVVCLE